MSGYVYQSCPDTHNQIITIVLASSESKEI